MFFESIVQLKIGDFTMIDLNSERQGVIDLATELFEKFVTMPKDLRPDKKERTGIQILIWESGTKNLLMASIKEPSRFSKFFAVEKAVRMNINYHSSSANSANFDAMEFPGSVSAWLNDLSDFEYEGDPFITASTSGLRPEEDVAISVAILAEITGVPFATICKNIDSYGGILPYWYSEKDKGIFQFLFE